MMQFFLLLTTLIFIRMLICIKTLKSKAAETNGAGHCHVKYTNM